MTILVGVQDTAEKIVRDALEKYGLEKENPRNFHLVEVSGPANENRVHLSISDLRTVNGAERVIPSGECPLMTLLNRPENSGKLVFHNWLPTI